jgi:hypothetical protein
MQWKRCMITLMAKITLTTVRCNSLFKNIKTPQERGFLF